MILYICLRILYVIDICKLTHSSHKCISYWVSKMDSSLFTSPTVIVHCFLITYCPSLLNNQQHAHSKENNMKPWHTLESIDWNNAQRSCHNSR